MLIEHRIRSLSLRHEHWFELVLLLLHLLLVLLLQWKIRVASREGHTDAGVLALGQLLWGLDMLGLLMLRYALCLDLVCREMARHDPGLAAQRRHYIIVIIDLILADIRLLWLRHPLRGWHLHDSAYALLIRTTSKDLVSKSLNWRPLTLLVSHHSGRWCVSMIGPCD